MRVKRRIKTEFKLGGEWEKGEVDRTTGNNAGKYKKTTVRLKRRMIELKN